MRASYLFITLMILTGMVVLFGDLPASSFPPVVHTILGQNPNNNTWYKDFRLWQFDTDNGNDIEDETNVTLGTKIWGILNTVGQYAVVGGATALGIITKTEYLIFGPLAVTMGLWFQYLWYGILISSGKLDIISPLNYFIYGILTFVYWFAVLEWLRGKA